MKLQQMESIRVRSMLDIFCDYAERVPPDKQEWKPDGALKSAKELLEHIAAGNAAFTTALKGERFEVLIEKEERQHSRIETSNYEEAISTVRSTGAKLVETIKNLPDDQLKALRIVPWGEQFDVPRLFAVASAHITYHWGQLAYLQTMWGDYQDRM